MAFSSFANLLLTAALLILSANFVHTVTTSGKVFVLGKEKTNKTGLYCTGTTTQKPEGCRHNDEFPGDTVVDALLRSRWSAPGPFDGGMRSTDENMPGFMADGKMELTRSNNYILPFKELRATAQVDHILCKDEGCSSFFDIYWGTNSTPTDDFFDASPGSLFLRYSVLAGTDQVLPIWSPGETEAEYGCSDSELPYISELDVLKRCNWLPPKQAVDNKISPSFWQGWEAVAGLDGFVVDMSKTDIESEKVTMKIGNFFDQRTRKCITLIVPISEVMEKLGWGNSDNCSNPNGTYLFSTYAILAYSSDTQGSSQGRPPALKENFDAAGVSVTTCLTFITRPSWKHCELCSDETADVGCSYNTSTLLVIDGRPIWAINVTSGNPSCSLGRALYNSAAASLSLPWCKEKGSCSKRGRDAGVIDCNDTETMRLLQMNTAGSGKLEDLRSAFVQGSPLILHDVSIIGPMGDQIRFSGIQQRNIKSAINESLITIATNLEVTTLVNLAGCDPTATTFGAFTNLMVTLFSCFITFLGVEDAFRGCKDISEKIGLSPTFPAVGISLVTAAALLIPPITFLIQDITSMNVNFKGDEVDVAWFLQKVDYDDEEPFPSHVGTVVSITYKSTYSSMAQPLGWATLVIALGALVFSMCRVWRGICSCLSSSGHVRMSKDNEAPE